MIYTNLAVWFLIGAVTFRMLVVLSAFANMDEEDADMFRTIFNGLSWTSVFAALLSYAVWIAKASNALQRLAN